MALANSISTVGTSAVELVGPFENSQYVYIQNADYDGSAEIYVGDKDVTTANGFRVWRNNVVMLQIDGGDSLYCVSDTADTEVRFVTIR